MTPILAASAPKALWYASRGTGVVCLLLLTTSVVLGIVTSVRFETPHWPRFVLEGLHRNVSLLILLFVALHVVTTVIDGFVPISYIDAVIPFRSPYRTIWLGLGAVAFDLLLALAITSIVRARLGYRTWRAVHWLAYACWPIALVHGLGTGSDARQGWMVLLDVIALALVCSAVSWRLVVSWRPEAVPGQWGAVAALVVVPMALALWAFAGPLQPGWARTKRAGSVTSAGALANEPERGGFGGAVNAVRSVNQSSNSDTTTESIRGALGGASGIQLDLELTGRAVDGGVALSFGQLTLGPAAAPSRWTGHVAQLNGGHVEARVTDGANHWLRVALDLRVDPSSNQVTGTVSARASGAPTSGDN